MSIVTNLSSDLFLKINKTKSKLISLEIFGILYRYETTKSVWYLKAIKNPSQPALLLSIVHINWLTLQSQQGMRAQGLPLGVGDCCAPLPKLILSKQSSSEFKLLFNP